MSMTKVKREMTKAVPAYQRIKSAILDNIHSGKWQAGEAISTEMALAKEFGVSRMTVNRALKELSQERVLERRQGSGTFVAQQQFNHTFVEVRNIAQDLKSAKETLLLDIEITTFSKPTNGFCIWKCGKINYKSLKKSKKA